MTAAAAALVVALTGCGLLNGDDGDGSGEDSTRESTEQGGEDPRAEPEDVDFPYVREGLVHYDGGSSTRQFAVTGLERTDEYTVLHYETTHLEGDAPSGDASNLPALLVDPVTGTAAAPVLDTSERQGYGSVTPNGDQDFPREPGYTNELRLYFPRFDDEVTQLNIVGTGHGVFNGLPIEDVEEERPFPEDPNTADPDYEPQEGDTLQYEVKQPDGAAEESVGGLRSFVDTESTFTTRDDDTETIALRSDVMFEFDEAELTDEAEETVREAASALEHNIHPEHPEIAVVGHTDGEGADDYNQELSEERAETVRGVLEEELDRDYTFEVEGRAAEEPVAEEGGSDDEEARARNRRVEFSYRFDDDADDQGTNREEGVLESSERYGFEPAPFAEDPAEETEATETDGDLQLDVHSLVRDGAYVLGTVSLTNTGEEPVRPDLVGDDLPGTPDNFTSGSLGGFQLVEPDSGVTRYVTFVDLGEYGGGDFAEEVTRVEPGDTHTLAAVFPAPPQEVDEVTLRAGTFGDIQGVPLQ